MRSSALLEIATGLEHLPIEDHVKSLVRQLVRAVAARHNVKGVELSNRVAYAKQILAQGVARTAVMERLRSRFEISREQAYRDIRSALKLCQKSSPHDTHDGQNNQETGTGCTGKKLEDRSVNKSRTTNKAASAASKFDTGALLTIDEVAAKLDVSHSTIHRLPLRHIRIGRSLRFDPVDLGHLIESSKVPLAAA